MFYINLTTYKASPAQREMGVIDIDNNVVSALKDLLSFPVSPCSALMQKRAEQIAEIAATLSSEHHTINVLIHAKMYFVPSLVSALTRKGLESFVTYAPKTIEVNEGKITRNYTHQDIVSCIPA